MPLALSARLGGTVGHYGPSDDATAPLPPHVVLPPVERVPAQPAVDPNAPDPNAAGAAGAEGGAAGTETGTEEG